LKELLGAAPGIDAIQEALLTGFAERLGITAPAPLPLDAFEGLPLPDALW